MNEWNNVSCVTGGGEGGVAVLNQEGARTQAISHGKLNEKVSAYKAKSLQRYVEL